MLTGQSADHFDPAAGLPEGAFDEVGVPDPHPVLPREPQVDRQRVALGEQTAHCCGVGVAPALGERIDAPLGDGHRVQPGRDGVGQVEDGPVVGLHVGLGVFGHLGHDVSSAVDQTALSQCGAHGAFDRADQSGRAVGDDQQWAGQPAFTQPGQESFPGVAGLRGGGFIVR